MANYNVDIAVSIKNAEKLSKFNKQIKDVSLNIKSANEFISNFSKSAKLANQVLGDGLVRNVDNLQKNLGLAKTNLKNVTLGTKEAAIAAYQFVKAQEQLNKGLQEELALIKEVEKGRRFTRFAKAGIRETPNAYSSPIGPGQASSVLGGQSVPVAGKIERTLALRRDEIRLQEALLALELKSAETENQKLQIRGELNRQTAAAVNNARFIGQSSPLTSPVFPGYSGPIGPGQASGLFSGGAFRERLMSNLSASQASREASAFGIRPGTQYDRPIGPAFSAVMKSQLRHQKKIDKNTGKTAQLLSASSNRAIFSNQIVGGTQYSAPIGPSRAPLLNRLGFGQGANPQGPFANSRGRAGRIAGSVSSGLIGGGFPLLFGQGPLAALGGGIGGLAGGALGGGFGFGLSIAGTAIASRIQESIDFRKSISDLNDEMGKMGISSNISAKAVSQLGKSLGITKQEAVGVLQEFKRFGNNAILFAKSFGGDFAKFDALSQANTVESALSAIRKINKDLTLEDELKLILSIQRKGVEATINELITDTLEKQKELDTKDFKKTEGSNRIRPGVLRKQSEELKTINERNAQTVKELTKVRDLQNQIRIASEENSYSIVKGLQDVNAELRRLNSAQFQIVELSKTLGSAFSESFKGIIKGTMSVQDAFRNMFMRIADHFLDMAAQMMAAQISRGFLGLFGNAFSSFSFAGSASAYPNAFDTSFDMGLLGFANGGRPPVGRPSIVGEKGPELFVPNTAGTIIPNHAMGGMNIVVNVDASGTNVEGDEEQGRELGRLISVAVQSEIIQQQRPGGLLA